MLTFEKVLKVFQAYLEDDPLYEVVQTSHGYTYSRRTDFLICHFLLFSIITASEH